MTTTNKEAVEIMTKYLKENAKIEDVYRTLANCMLDYNRTAYWLERMPKINSADELTEFLYFATRMQMNSKQFQKVISGDTTEPFTCGTLEEWKGQ